MNFESVQMNRICPPSNYFHQKLWTDERIEQGEDATTMTMKMTMAMTMAADITMALGNESDWALEGCNSLPDDTMYAPPLLERQRSSSPRSVSDISLVDLLGKDSHVTSTTNMDDDNADDCFPVDPLPLATSSSLDLMHMMEDYFNHDAVKELLPKTKLTIYSDKERKTNQAAGDKSKDELKLLDSFPLLTESEKEDDPFKFLVSTNPKSTKIPSVEIDGPECDQHGKNSRRSSRKKATNVKSVSKSKRAAKVKVATKRKPDSKAKVPTRVMPVLKAKLATKVKPVSKAKKPIKRKISPKKTVPKEIKQEEIVTTKTVPEEIPQIKTAPKNNGIVPETWDINYKKLEAFYLENNHSNVLRSDSDKKLSGWVKRQRNNMRVGSLTPTQIQRLDKLDFVWNRLENAWDSKYKLLKEYEAVNGTCRICSAEFRSLAEWTQRQRREYIVKKPNLSLSRIQRLEAIPTWSWEKPTQTQSIPRKKKARKASRSNSDSDFEWEESE